MLVDYGACAVSTAADLISDTCGYTDADAIRLASNVLLFLGKTMRRNKMCAILYTAYRENRLCNTTVIRKTAQEDVSLSIGKAVMADQVKISIGKCKRINR